MLKQLSIDINNGVKIILILLIIIVFLSSCNKDYNLVIIKTPSQLTDPVRKVIVLYDLSNDTLLIKENSSFWGENKLEYVKLNENEKSNIINRINTISTNKINHSYLSIDDGVPFGYNIEAMNNNKLLFSSLIHSKNYPKEVDNLYNYINTIVSKKKRKSILLFEDSLNNLRIKSIINQNDTIYLSRVNSYLIWKEINIGKNKELNKYKEGKYRLGISYWIEYKGNKIETLTTNDGKLFYLNRNNKTYSFELNRKISLKKSK